MTGTLEILANTSMRASFAELVPRFESTTGERVVVTFDAAKLMLERIAKGERADLMIHTTPVMDELQTQGKLVPASRRELTRNGIGMAVLAGAPRPDISSVAAFKRALLDAKTIACTSAGASGI